MKPKQNTRTEFPVMITDSRIDKVERKTNNMRTMIKWYIISDDVWFETQNARNVRAAVQRAFTIIIDLGLMSVKASSWGQGFFFNRNCGQLWAQNKPSRTELPEWTVSHSTIIMHFSRHPPYVNRIYPFASSDSATSCIAYCLTNRQIRINWWCKCSVLQVSGKQ